MLETLQTSRISGKPPAHESYVNYLAQKLNLGSPLETHYRVPDAHLLEERF